MRKWISHDIDVIGTEDRCLRAKSPLKWPILPKILLISSQQVKESNFLIHQSHQFIPIPVGWSVGRLVMLMRFIMCFDFRISLFFFSHFVFFVGCQINYVNRTLPSMPEMISFNLSFIMKHEVKIFRLSWLHSSPAGNYQKELGTILKW